jgi:hypothetical protein
MPKPLKSPFDVDLSPEQQTQLAQRLSDEIQGALDARQAIIGTGGDLDYWLWYYEQGQNKASRPWPGAADLTSYIITEAVDAMRARMVKTIFVEPVYIVEGWGDSSKKAPAVEEFHQWKVEEERLQTRVSKVVHTSLLEGTGILEVAEGAEKRKVRNTRDLAIETDATGAPILDEKHQPILKRDPETGDFINQTGPGSARTVVSEVQTIRKGPQYRGVSLRDFLFLPGHAQEMSEVWGRAKRFHRRLSELQAREEAGVYQNVNQLSATSDRQATPNETRSGQQIAPQTSDDQLDTIEKELWELQVLLDLDGDGMDEYYLVTLSVEHRVLLRCKHDDIGQERYLAFIPFPKPGSVYGYSLPEKLITLAEEHTAIRNMAADRSTLATNAPILRVQGSLWDPAEQRFGPGAVLDVRDKGELVAMQIPDVPASVIERERNVLQAKERVSGQNDIAIGSTPEVGRTLGEIQIRTEQSFVRMDEAIRYMQETMEDLGQLRHTLWIRAAEADPKGINAPSSVVRSLEMKGAQIPDGAFTAEMLKGTFRFKPRGSVETADMAHEQQYYNQWLNTMGELGKMFPTIIPFFNREESVRALIEQGLRVNRVRDRQAFLPPPGQKLLPPAPQPGVPGSPTAGAPGAPAGLPPQLMAAIAGAGGPAAAPGGPVQ